MNPDVLIFLGPPGIGKGTQAGLLAASHGLAHISSGELIRDERTSGTALGKFMDEIGWREPETLDRLVTEALAGRLQKETHRGIILDGCPRSLYQAIELEKLFLQMGRRITAVIEFYGDEEILTDRIVGRYACRQCKSIYHDTQKPTHIENKCDICDSETLYRRPEDSVQTMAERMETYRTMTLPMIGHYAARGLVKRLDGMPPTDTVRNNLAALIY